jgi:branched-chain amino acid transport system substrate-binding protein
VVVSEDTEASGAIGLEKARELVENDKVDVLTGIVSSYMAIAIRDYVIQNEIPLILEL